MDRGNFMNADIFIIGKSHTNIVYTSVLIGYGYKVNDLQTFDAARIVLRTGNNIPRAIVVDMNNQSEQVKQFIQFVRQEVSHNIGMVVIGSNNNEAENAYKNGATLFLYRPVESEGLVDVIRDELHI
jgi:DNA-binding NtrC family response regulator